MITFTVSQTQLNVYTFYMGMTFLLVLTSNLFWNKFVADYSNVYTLFLQIPY